MGPTNYDQAGSPFKEISKGALDRVIEEPDSEAAVFPAVSPAFKEQSAPAPKPEFKDDPLATEVEHGQAANFMAVFSKMDKLERMPADEDASSGMKMPPAIELEEDPEAAAAAALPKLDFKKPSQPISQGFEKMETSTADEVSKEDHVPAEGSTQAAAEKSGEKQVAKAAAKKAAKKDEASGKKTGIPSKKAETQVKKTAKKEAKKQKTLSKQTNPGAVSVTKSGILKAAPKSSPVETKNSASSLRGATYFTVAITALTAFMVGAL